MKRIALLVSSIFLACAILAQGKFLSNEGRISFYSHTPLEDIKASHGAVSAVVDPESGEVAVIATMTGFRFKKKLMEEHFNENYVESEKYPKSTFNGKILNNSEVDYSRPGKYDVKVSGDLTIHGVSKEITVPGSLEVLEKGIRARTTFIVRPEDYEIKIPRVVRKNIAEEVEVSFEWEGAPF